MCYLGADLAVVQHGKCLVIDEFVHGGRVHHVVVDRRVSPMGPVVALERDLHIAVVKGHGLGDVLRPRVAVAHLGAAQRVQVVQRAGAVFGNPQRAPVGDPRVHFRRRFGAGRQLELHAHAVDGQSFAGCCHFVRGADEACFPGRLPVADAHGKRPLRAFVQVAAVLVRGAAPHGVAGVRVLGHGVLQKNPWAR